MVHGTRWSTTSEEKYSMGVQAEQTTRTPGAVRLISHDPTSNSVESHACFEARSSFSSSEWTESNSDRLSAWRLVSVKGRQYRPGSANTTWASDIAKALSCGAMN